MTNREAANALLAFYVTFYRVHGKEPSIQVMIEWIAEEFPE